MCLVNAGLKGKYQRRREKCSFKCKKQRVITSSPNVVHTDCKCWLQSLSRLEAKLPPPLHLSAYSPTDTSLFSVQTSFPKPQSTLVKNMPYVTIFLLLYPNPNQKTNESKNKSIGKGAVGVVISDIVVNCLVARCEGTKLRLQEYNS